MDYLADMGIIHCAECGRLFRPHGEERTCSGCRGQEMTSTSAVQDVSPHERAAAFYRAFGALETGESDSVAAAPLSLEDEPTCIRCREHPAHHGARLCRRCRQEVESSLGKAAGEVFKRIREVHHKSTGAFNVHEAMNEKRNLVPGPGPNYSGAPRYKY